MTDGALAVVELLLTARHYTDERSLDPNDLPPRIRKVYWSDGEIERPLVVTEDDAAAAAGIDDPWAAVSDLMFTDRDGFTDQLSLTQPELAEEWFLERADDELLGTNPTLAHLFEGRDGVEVDYESARGSNRPIQADRAWIDGLLAEYFDEDDEEMLDLVDVKAPEEIEMTLGDLVLTPDQEDEIRKIGKAIEHREYLAEIGLREIGKLLFVGPPGTGKTSVARALAHQLDLPFVEVKLSMVTSQYLGETSKNVDRTFEVAKRLSPCILFMDEFDSVAKTRRSDEHAALKRAVNTLLKSIDEISLIRDDVLLIGATNHPDQLDAAAWRRFDEIVNFPRPDRDMRRDIFGVITRRMDIEGFDADELAEATEGLTGSDIRLVLREAVLEALAQDRRQVTQADLLAAVDDFEERDNLKNLEAIEDGEVPAGEAEEGHDHAHDHDAPAGSETQAPLD
ncbi:MAG: ATP-binding protein [Halobacteriales archaeon]